MFECFSSWCCFWLILIGSGSCQDGVAISASCFRAPDGKKDVVLVLFGYDGSDGNWVIKAREPFWIRYYDNNQKPIAAVGEMVTLGEMKLQETRVFSIEVTSPPSAMWATVEFGSSGLRTKLIPIRIAAKPR